jgi:hypothetical protein
MGWQEEDQQFLLSASIELGDYLSSSVLDWNLRDSRLVLTPGRLLLSMRRVSALKETDSKIISAIKSMDMLIRTRNLLWQKKVTQEIPGRLRVWENALLDFGEEGLDKSYSAQVIHRVILSLLEEDNPDLFGQFDTRLELADGKLRKIITNGDFIWDKELEGVFPQKEFWFLYCV